jgi:hypothetical protein
MVSPQTGSVEAESKGATTMTEQQPALLYHTHESQQTAEEILAYWTPERLAAAQPFGEGHPADENRAWPAARQVSPAAEEPGALTFETTPVPTDELEKFPYQSVGKLFFSMGGENWAGSAARRVRRSMDHRAGWPFRDQWN